MSVTAAAGLAALALFTSACSGSGSHAAAAKSTADTASDKAYKLRECLRKHGMDVAEPSAGSGNGIAISGGGDQAKMAKAMEACKQYSLNPSGELTQAEKDKRLKFAQCMRKNGYNMPDPSFGPNGGAMQAPTGSELGAFNKASKACAAYS
ncbi:hypothetical protein [Actinacidiphila oryziradicis]|nr:hypothetical protein [Actinacidiphila oryziradicis]